MQFIIAPHPVTYDTALLKMERLVEDILAGTKPETIWLLEHPPLYTSGTSSRPEDLRNPEGFPTYGAGRGGQWTYHGPGQLVAYVMLDLKRRSAQDLRAYVKQLEQWIIDTLAHYNIEGFIREGRVGVWVSTPTGECKIAAIGVRVRQWVTFHGLSLNVNPNLKHYEGIVPCGLPQFGVTSLHEMGVKAEMAEVMQVLQAKCPF